MKFIILWLPLLQCALGTHVSIKLPYRSPADVTYVEGKASADLVAGPYQRATNDNLTESSESESFQKYETSQDISTAASVSHAKIFCKGSQNRTYSSAVPARTTATSSGNYIHPGASGTTSRQPFFYQFLSSTPTYSHQPTFVRKQPGIPQDYSTGFSSPAQYPVTAQGNSVRTSPSFSSGNTNSFNATSRSGIGYITPTQGFPTYSTVATPNFQPVSVVHPSVVPVPSEGFVLQSPNVALISPMGYPSGHISSVESQDGVNSKTVDVAQPAIKTSRYEVRRPAIKKDFYDIEERIIVRPAGSVVLELDHPISRTAKGEIISDYGNQAPHNVDESLQGSNLNLEIGTPSEHGIISQTNQQNQYVQNVHKTADDSGVDEVDGPVKIQTSTHGANTEASTPEPITVPTIPVYEDNDSVVVEARLTADNKTSQSPYNNEFPPSTPYNSNESPSSSSYNSHGRTTLRNFIQYQPESLGGQPQAVQCTAACQRQARVNYQQQGAKILPPFVQHQNNYYSHHARSNQPPSSQPGITYYYQQNTQQRAHEPSAEQHGRNYQYHGQQKAPQYYQQNPHVNFQSAQQGTQYYQQEQNHKSQQAEYYDGIASNQQNTDQYEQQIAEEQAQVTQVDKDWNSQKNSVPFMVAVGEPDFRYPPYVETSPDFDAKSSNQSGKLRAYNEEEKSQQVKTDTVVNEHHVEEQPETRTTHISSKYENSPTLTHQESIENQRKYLNLLLARGGVSEVSAKLEQNEPRNEYLRSRVISATPAPFNAPPTGEQVHTRRIVVSHPLETIQQVEIQEPVTKFQRLSVKQPAQYRTARVDHTTRPIYSRAAVPVQPIAMTYGRIH